MAPASSSDPADDQVPEDGMSDARGRIPSPRELRLHVHVQLRRRDPAPAFAVLEGSLSALPRLEPLFLHLAHRTQRAERGGGFAGVLACAGARRALRGLGLHVAGPLAEAEADAIVALPPLEREPLCLRPPRLALHPLLRDPARPSARGQIVP
eukprot:tig00000903_g5524.t1